MQVKAIRISRLLFTHPVARSYIYTSDPAAPELMRDTECPNVALAYLRATFHRMRAIGNMRKIPVDYAAFRDETRRELIGARAEIVAAIEENKEEEFAMSCAHIDAAEEGLGNLSERDPPSGAVPNLDVCKYYNTADSIPGDSIPATAIVDLLTELGLATDAPYSTANDVYEAVYRAAYAMHGDMCWMCAADRFKDRLDDYIETVRNILMRAQDADVEERYMRVRGLLCSARDECDAAILFVDADDPTDQTLTNYASE